MNRHGVLGGDRAEHDRIDRPAGRGVDGGELVDLADAFEVADVEAVHGDEIAGPGSEVAEPERLSSTAGSVTSPPMSAARRGSAGDTLVTAAQSRGRPAASARSSCRPRSRGRRAGPRTGGSPDRRLGHRDGQQLVQRRASGSRSAAAAGAGPWASAPRARSAQPRRATHRTSCGISRTCGTSPPRCRSEPRAPTHARVAGR